MYAEHIEFGADAFGATNGYLVLAAASTSPNCSNICTAHGMGCYDGFLIGGGDSSCTLIGSYRYCWCGRA
ncbi:MAG: hypothetical protein KJ955_08730 [Nanoarchaeota archaeon]|nr:hypothetical protein [Nanoarchaeota archaeon]